MKTTAKIEAKTAPKTEALWFLDALIRIHVAGDANDDGMSVIEHTMPHGFAPPLHVHHREDEVFHLLEGAARFMVDGRQVRAKAGDTVVAPKGKPHSFIVTSPDGARWLTITSRGDFERMARIVGRPAEHDILPPRNAHPTPAQKQALAAACRENRIELVGPPLA